MTKLWLPSIIVWIEFFFKWFSIFLALLTNIHIWCVWIMAPSVTPPRIWYSVNVRNLSSSFSICSFYSFALFNDFIVCPDHDFSFALFFFVSKKKTRNHKLHSHTNTIELLSYYQLIHLDGARFNFLPLSFRLSCESLRTVLFFYLCVRGWVCVILCLYCILIFSKQQFALLYLVFVVHSSTEKKTAHNLPLQQQKQNSNVSCETEQLFTV